jgi:hypothetical protein
MRSVEWRRNVVRCTRGGQCVRWSDVETWSVVSAEGNAFGGMAWKRGSLYLQRAMRSVEWCGNVVRCIRGGKWVRWSDAETWFVVSAEGKAFGGMAWKRGSLHPRSVAFRRQMRKMRWCVVPYIRESQHVCGYTTANQQIIFTVTYLTDHRWNYFDFTASYNFCFGDNIVCVKHSEHYCVPPSLGHFHLPIKCGGRGYWVLGSVNATHSTGRSEAVLKTPDPCHAT